MSTVLLVLSLICAVIATIMGFAWFGIDATHLFGWLSLAIVFFVSSILAPRVIK